jgi:hypothetical protein
MILFISVLTTNAQGFTIQNWYQIGQIHFFEEDQCQILYEYETQDITQAPYKEE